MATKKKNEPEEEKKPQAEKKTKAKPAETPQVQTQSSIKSLEAKEKPRPDPKPESKARVPGAAKAPLNQGTIYAKHGQLSQWSLVDAANVPLGRLSSFVATLLMGKTKAFYTPHADTGDFVVVINAKEVQLTGKKWDEKKYYWHTNYPGGIKCVTASELLRAHPERLVEWAVSGMLPKSHMGRRWLKKLRVFPGTDHPHVAQRPQAAKLPNVGNIGERV